MLERIVETGVIGLNKDLSSHELPNNAWTDVRNIRFEDGYLQRAPGYSKIYGAPFAEPQYLQPAASGSSRYWI